MSDSEMDSFGKTAKSLSGSPLGIIALFIVLIYGFAALTLGISAKNLGTALQVPLVWFLVLFPVLVLLVFARLVTNHHQKLYGPSDFTDQALFMELQQELRELKSEVNPVIERQIEDEPITESTKVSLPTVHINEGEEKILKILTGGKYTYRTIRGLAKEAGIPSEEARMHVESLVAEKLVGEKMLKNGPRWYVCPKGREIIAKKTA